MVKPEESNINDDKRFTREGSVDVSSKYDRDQWTEESSSDEVEERSDEAVEKEKKEEKVKTKLSAYQDFEKNERATRIKENLLNSNSINLEGINKTYIYGSVLIVGIAVLCYLLYSTCNNPTNVKHINANISHDTSRVDQFSNTIKKIKNDFPSQKDILWLSLFKRIKYVTESHPTRPAIMILLYNRNKNVAECIAWKVGKAAREFFNTPAVIELIGDSDMNETDNELVDRYRERLQKNGVMIVYRLDEIPGLVAQSFHTFCDTQNPLVKRAVLLFTLDRSRLRNVEINKPTRIASEVLRLLWNDTLNDFQLNSLITRLTDSVLEIHSEKDDFKCVK
ncbi:torsin interacting protein isoform X2 [Rhodnius prolixus]|uniref:torsin interacting protein isoform X2 n=1 Tax=Rhodnius prolixus TaxID=13249 RepID=UPI003D18EA40